jgi:hypothetical protein
VDELIFGSPAHRPMSAGELMSWIAYDEIAADERRKREQ